MATEKKSVTTSYCFLLVLLFSRLLSAILYTVALMMENRIGLFSISKSIFNWADIFDAIFIFTGFIGITVVILVNRERLQDINIDSSFIIFYLLFELALIYQSRLAIKIPLSLLTVCQIYYLVTGKIKLGKLGPGVWQSCIVVIIIFVAYVSRNWHLLSPSDIFFIEDGIALNCIYAAFEEFLFRGLLWMILRRLKWKEFWILIFQLVLFMISHLQYSISNPIFFWIGTSGGGLIFGIMAWRSKSLTPSTITHFFYNVLVDILRVLG